MESTPILSDEDRAALSKYGRIQLRAHGSAVALRELGEFRRYTQAAITTAKTHLEELRKSDGQGRERALRLSPSQSREFANVDPSTISVFLEAERARDQAQFNLKWNGTLRTVEVCELRLRLLDEQEAALKAISAPLLATSGALRKHLASTGVLANVDW